MPVSLLRVAILTLAAWTCVAQAQSAKDRYQERLQAELVSAQDKVAQQEKLYGPESMQLASALDSLAGSLSRLDKIADAEQAYLRALGIVEKSRFDPGHAIFMNHTEKLAEFYLQSDLLPKAEATFNVVLKNYAERYGPTEQSVVTSLNGIGTVYYKRHDFKTAKRYFDQALSVVDQAKRPDAVQGLRAWQYKVQMYKNVGDEKNATAMGDMAFDADERWNHAYHSTPLQRCQTLQAVYRSHAYFGRAAKAERALDAIASTCNRIYGTVPFYAAEFVLLKRADLKVERGEMEKAEAGYREVLTYPEGKGEDNLHLLAARVSLVALFRAKGDEKAAAVFQRQVLAQEGAVGYMNAKWLSEQRNNLGRVYLRRGKVDLAESLFKDAVGSRSDPRDKDDNPALQNICDLAELYASRGELARAEPLFRQALDASAHIFGPDDLYSARAASGLVAIYEKSGRRNEADKLGSRLKKMLEHGL
jgi:tetratricopeptide (TPR) repeat protein